MICFVFSELLSLSRPASLWQKLHVLFSGDDSKFWPGSFFHFVGRAVRFFAVLFNAWSAGDEMRPADYRFYPMDFPSPLETDSATGGTIAYVDWQKGRKNFWKTGKKREKSCAKEQKTLAN